MNKVLVPIDGSENSMDALRHVLRTNPADALQVLVLNVQPLLTRHISRFVSSAEREAWREERASIATRKASEELQRHRVTFSVKVATGTRAEAIIEAAEEEGCSKIVVGTARKSSLTRLLENSVTSRLLENSPVPVEVVNGREASSWERWGIPATLGAALAAAVAVAD
ncbi:MAG TPA: universal stress protein [Burkholderiaceae bacterium]|nr:universal stress protein [Burkholderiaceae bacterium]